MKRAYILPPVLLLSLVVSGFAFSETADASYLDIIHGANAEFDYVIQPTEVDRHVYLGMDGSFDKAFLDLELKNFEGDEADLIWEYQNEKGGWTTLTGKELSSAAARRSSIEFSAPANWDARPLKGQTAHWVRAHVDGGDMSVTRTMARTYNVKLHVENHLGDEIVFLNERHFDLENGGDNTIYGFQNLGNGDYQLAVNPLVNDKSYMLLVDVKDYLNKGIQFEFDAPKTVINRTVVAKLDSICQNPFTDLGYHWAKSEAREVYCRDDIDGGENFMPNEEMTRSEFVEHVVTTADISTKVFERKENPFDDAQDDAFVNTAYHLGIVDENTEFRPDDAITRAEATAVLVRLAGAPVISDDSSFSDVKLGNWYTGVIRTAETYGLAEGYADGTFRPEVAIARSEAITLVNNAFHIWFK